MLQGRLVIDPDLRSTPNGTSVTSFRIAVARDYNREKTDWIDVVAWRQTAEFICKYFGKGSMILLTGSIQTRNYDDKNGNKRTAVEVVADQVYFCESKNTERQESSFPLPNEPKQESFSIDNPDDYEELDSDDDDLPWNN